ncbi:Fic family protein [Parapedobacter sp. DT-150]|uniref:Fic family protein n=1 Tax=Parapedobacter sp. DT-150 TaxID=3396162 RepID=UPI003F1A7A63
MVKLEAYESGHVEKGVGGYSYFVPSPINMEWKWDNPTINGLLEEAAIKLGELNSFARLVPNIDLFIHLHVTKEAVKSSRIEGTQTNIEEALLEEREISPERRDDWKEVNNYIRAQNYAIAQLERLPISSRLIRKAHALLLEGVRGEHKQPGAFRTSQNWIGGTSPADAVFVPPHHQYVEALMGDLENFLHNEGIIVPKLIRIGIAHYQFETIHPFLDGNGRIGRLMIPLFLIDSKILEKPLLYLSTYFERNKGLYYDNLTFVRTKNDMIQWLKYFLVGVAEMASEAAKKLSLILELKSDMEILINGQFGRKSNSAMALLQYLFKQPIVFVEDAKQATGLSYKAANNLIADFESSGILKETTGQSRNRSFVFDKYLDLFRKD